MNTSLNIRDKQGLSSIAKALGIVEYVGLAGRRSLAEISAHTGLPRSTLLRLVSTLVDLGFLRRTGHGEYGIALKLWRIGCAAVDFEHVHDAIVPILRDVVAKTSETAVYAVYDTGRAVYVEKVEGLHPIRAYALVGGHSPAYATATGKALLSWQTEEEIRRVTRDAVSFTAATLTDTEEIFRRSADIRRQGFAVNRGEWREGVWGVAAPIFGRGREPVAAVGVTGPRDRVEPQIDQMSLVVCEAASTLSIHHGSFRPVSPKLDGFEWQDPHRVLHGRDGHEPAVPDHVP